MERKIKRLLVVYKKRIKKDYILPIEKELLITYLDEFVKDIFKEAN